MFLFLLQQVQYQTADGCLTTDESQFIHQPVIDTFCGMALLLGAVGIFFQAVLDESLHILCQNGGFPAVVFMLLGHTATVTILLDGIPGNLQGCGDLPMTFAL